MEYVGQITITSKGISIDAAPYIMRRVRSLFNSRVGYRGKFTKKTVIISKTNSNFKDINWLMQRYNFRATKSDLKQIKSISDSYDKLLAEIPKLERLTKIKTSKDDWVLKDIELRQHQIHFNNLANKVNRILLADKMGLGKTISALSLLTKKERRPALIVVPPTICTQWKSVISELLPFARIHVIKGRKKYKIPDNLDIMITSYSRINAWQDFLISQNFKTLIFDEVHELRHLMTQKRSTARLLSESVEMCIGMSGTPIFNYGSEIWSVLDVIKPNCLGSSYDFYYEWCDSYDKKVCNPTALNSYLKSEGLFLRRSPEDVGLHFGELSKDIYTIDCDLEKLKEMDQIAKTLALTVLSGKVGDASDAARDFNIKLRQQTGLAKARSVAEFIKMILNEEEKVLLTGWHRGFYDIVLKELKKYNPVLITGSESPTQKAKNLETFINGDSRVCIISLRSGAGIDGLQHVSNVIVHGELDWSPHVHDQLNTRLQRDGQKKHVRAYYLTVKDGSDPYVIQTLNVKRNQHEGVIEGRTGEGEILDNTIDKDRIQKMAKGYLKSIGEEIPDIIEDTGLLKEVSDFLNSLKLSYSKETEMQSALYEKLLGKFPDVNIQKEYVLSKKSRLDFLVSNKDEKIIIECKTTAKNRQDVYRQIRRYIEECEGITSLILFAPWHGINDFIIDDIPIKIVDISAKSI